MKVTDVAGIVFAGEVGPKTCMVHMVGGSPRQVIIVEMKRINGQPCLVCDDNMPLPVHDIVSMHEIETVVAEKPLSSDEKAELVAELDAYWQKRMQQEVNKQRYKILSEVNHHANEILLCLSDRSVPNIEMALERARRLLDMLERTIT